jgi:L-lactate dehydrogenase (cytochrome)
MFDFIDGAAEDESTLRRNTEAFLDYDLVPRYLVDVGEVDLRTRVLGIDLAWPVVLAPTGMSRLFHHTGEISVARAAARSGTIYSLSTTSSVSIEDVGRETNGPKMFQVYVFRDNELNLELLDRSRQAGFSAVCLTVDVPALGNRERDLRSGLTVPPTFGLGSLLDFALRPAWVWNYFTHSELTPANVAHRIDRRKRNLRSIASWVNTQYDPSVTWERAREMIEYWGGPFAIKGILCANDARRAVEIGATAIIVSNHGGRQLDGAVASFDILEEIVEAVGGQAEVILDGGIRRGSHVVKALALGADACMVGRPYLYGLGAGGEQGVDRAISILKSEIERVMRLIGCCRIGDINREFFRRRRR